MNIHVAPVPRHLIITQGMIEDLVCDPVFAAKFLLNWELDAFQKVRLRYYWWTPTVYDLSGVSSGKTAAGDWVYSVLRAILLPNYTDGHDVGVYFPTFDTMKQTFWRYFSSCTSPIFRAQLGEIKEDEGAGSGSRVERGVKKGAGTFVATFRSGGTVQCPAPGFLSDAQSQASRRYNTLVVEECTVIDAMGDGVDRVLIDRTTREGYNKNHPLWTNHFKYSAHAEFWTHPGMVRVKKLIARRRAGNPTVAVFGFSYKDYSRLRDSTGRTFADRFRADGTMAEKKAKRSPGEFQVEALGIPTDCASGFYQAANLELCVALGRTRNLLPLLGR